jgi:voltage-gated potassium channel
MTVHTAGDAGGLSREPVAAVTESSGQGPRFDHFAVRSDPWLSLLALAVLPVLLVEDRATDETLRAAAYVLNWGIWLAFCAEFVVKLWLARERLRYVRTAWLEITLIVLSPPFFVPETMEGLRALRAVRLLRVARMLRVLTLAGLVFRRWRKVLRAHNLHYVLLLGLGSVCIAGVAIYQVEGDENPAMQSIGDGLWWAIGTLTAGFGDTRVATAEGRFIAVPLIFVGLVVIAVFTATVASYFVERQQEEQLKKHSERLKSIDEKLDQLLRDRHM